MSNIREVFILVEEKEGIRECDFALDWLATRGRTMFFETPFLTRLNSGGTKNLNTPKLHLFVPHLIVSFTLTQWSAMGKSKFKKKVTLASELGDFTQNPSTTTEDDHFISNNLIMGTTVSKAAHENGAPFANINNLFEPGYPGPPIPHNDPDNHELKSRIYQLISHSRGVQLCILRVLDHQIVQESVTYYDYLKMNNEGEVVLAEARVKAEPASDTENFTFSNAGITRPTGQSAAVLGPTLEGMGEPASAFRFDFANVDVSSTLTHSESNESAGIEAIKKILATDVLAVAWFQRSVDERAKALRAGRPRPSAPFLLLCTPVFFPVQIRQAHRLQMCHDLWHFQLTQNIEKGAEIDAMVAKRVDLEKVIIQGRLERAHRKEISKLERTIATLEDSKKSKNEAELTMAYGLVAKYHTKTDKFLQILIKNSGASIPTTVAPSQAVRLLSAENEVGQEYKHLCLEVMSHYLWNIQLLTFRGIGKVQTEDKGAVQKKLGRHRDGK
jgi:hypothetical protein